jgi:hypothetical protein
MSTIKNAIVEITDEDRPCINEPMLNPGRQYGPTAHVYLEPAMDVAIQTQSVEALYTLADALVAAAQRLEAAQLERLTLTDIDGAFLPARGAA